MTNAEILEGASISLVFDGKPHKVRPLSIGKSRVWKKEYFERDASRVKTVEALPDDERMVVMLSESNPDFVLDMVVSYCEKSKPVDGQPPVTREVIEEGSLVEVGAAFQILLETEFPLTAVTAGQSALNSVLTPAAAVLSRTTK